MQAAGVEAIAVAFLHSYVNPENEREAGRLLAELAPEIAVTLSSDVLPQIKEYERTSTTVVNGYVKPLVRGYLKNLDDGLAAVGYTAPLRIMLSNGGLGSSEIAAEFPLRLIESGPVAGAIVGRQIAHLHEGVDKETQPRLGGQAPGADMWRIDEAQFLEIAHDVTHGSRRKRHRQQPRQAARSQGFASVEIAFDDAPENFPRPFIQQQCLIF